MSTLLRVVVVAVALGYIGVPARGQARLTPEELQADVSAGAQSGRSVGLAPVPRVDPATSHDWPLHNLDAANSRYAPLGQINSANVGSLAVRWLYHGNGGAPIVVDGLMYLTRRDGVVALNAATGRVVWRNGEAVGSRGAAHGDGTIYVAGGTSVMALDARTGEFVTGFGEEGVSNVLADVLQERYPALKEATAWGYRVNMAPQYHGGVIVVGTALSESHIPGGLILGIDAKTGEHLWTFVGVPQGPQDEGWEIAKDTWVGGARHGGGIWQTPAIDAATETLHLTIANPSPDQDGSARKGINLFTNAFVTLELRTGKLLWYYQQIHHDLWDYDAGQQPTLFDFEMDGRTVPATAAGNKNGLLYILNRETGEPINPIVETAVPTATETPGEEVWPTQPIPHTRAGTPMVPLAKQFPTENVFPQFGSYPKVPFYTPPTPNGALHAPREGVHYGSSSFHPGTGLLYVAGRDFPIMLTAIPVGDTLVPGQFSTAGRRVSAGEAIGNVSAYDPATGELAWRTAIDGGPSAGTLATAGNLVFTAARQGTFYAFDATTGELLWQFYPGGSVGAPQLTYEVNGVQYVTVSAGQVVVTFALPER
jgi:quinohemoprotein ethanol dehydrogenase